MLRSEGLSAHRIDPQVWISVGDASPSSRLQLIDDDPLALAALLWIA